MRQGLEAKAKARMRVAATALRAEVDREYAKEITATSSIIHRSTNSCCLWRSGAGGAPAANPN